MNVLAQEKKSITYPRKLQKNFLSGENYLWILKPTEFNQGRGIHVFDNLNQLERLINEYSQTNSYNSPYDNSLEKKKKK